MQADGSDGVKDLTGAAAGAFISDRDIISQFVVFVYFSPHSEHKGILTHRMGGLQGKTGGVIYGQRYQEIKRVDR